MFKRIRNYIADFAQSVRPPMAARKQVLTEQEQENRYEEMTTAQLVEEVRERANVVLNPNWGAEAVKVFDQLDEIDRMFAECRAVLFDDTPEQRRAQMRAV